MVDLSMVNTDFGGARSGTASFISSPRTTQLPSLSVGNVLETAQTVANLVNTGLDIADRFSGSGRVSGARSGSVRSSVVPAPPQGFGISQSFLPGRQVPLATQAMASIPSGVMAGARIGVAFVLRKIKANTGAKVTSKKIAAAIRTWGPATVAAWAGVTLAELMVVWDRGSRRVKRRFTKRDRSRGRAYIRWLKRNADELKDLGCGPKRRSPRKVC